MKAMMRSVMSKLGLTDMAELPIHDMLIWAGEALSHIGSVPSMERVTKKIEIINYAGQNPLDLYSLWKVEGHPRFKTIRGGFQVSLESGSVNITYDRMPTDDSGYVMFPADISTQEAVMWYVGKWLAMRDILPNKKLSFDYCDSQWQWYCSQARAEGYVPDMPEWERMVNTFNRMIPLDQEYENDFENINDPEVLTFDHLNSFPRQTNRRL